MKSILIICPNYDDNSVSSFRISSFESKLRSQGYQVSILTLSDYTKLDDSTKISYINRNFFKNSASLFHRLFMPKDFRGFLNKFESIVISMPTFELVSIVKYIESDKKVVLDYRDQLNLTYVFRKNRYKNPIAKLAIYLDFKYTELVHKRILYRNNIDKVICVGNSALDYYKSSISKKKEFDLVNIHNGFFLSDYKSIPQISSLVDFSKKDITFGISGSIYDFRFTDQLERELKKLDTRTNNKSITIKHWGASESKFRKLMESMSSIKYEPQGRELRDKYLQKIITCDVLILITSDELNWEPTTTVFDYILMSKPVMFFGDSSNEASKILNDCGVDLITVDNILSENRLEVTPIDFERLKKYNRESILDNLVI